MFENIFSSSPWVWTGLISALAVLPVLIHLINMLRHRRVKWAAMEFLLSSHKKNRNWIRLKQWLLLASRIAILLMILFMLGQVGCQNQRLSSMLGGNFTHHYVLIDDSFSMTDREAGVSALNRARETISRISARAKNRDRQLFTVIRFSRAEHFLANDKLPGGNSANPDDPAAPSDSPSEIQPTTDLNAQPVDSLFDQTIEEVRNKIEPTSLASGPEPALRLCEQLIENRAQSSTSSESAIIYVLSDFRSKDWQNASGLMQVIERLTTDQSEIQLINCAPSQQSNLAITALQPSGNIRVAGVPLMMQIEVKNFGKVPVRKIQIELASAAFPDDSTNAEPESIQPDTNSLPTILIDEIAAGESETRRFPVFFNQPGQHAIQASLNADTITADNHRWSITRFATSAKILLVDQESQQNAGFVSLALSPNQMTGIETIIGSKATLRDAKPGDLDEFETIILCDVDRLDVSAVRNLQQYTERGGGTVFFVGPNTNLRFYREILFEQANGLFPIPLGKVTSVPDQLEDPVPDIVPHNHPIFAPVLGVRNSLLDLVQIKKICQPTAQWLLNRDSDSEVVATVRGNKHQPLMVHRRVGKGHSVAVLTTAGPQWNNWSRNGTYPAILLLMQEYVSQGRSADRNLLAGETFEYSLPVTEYQSDVVFVAPAKNEKPAFDRTAWTVTASPDITNQQVLVAQLGATPGETDNPGIYESWLHKNQTQPQVNRFALNVDTSESDLTVIDRQQLVATLAATNPESANTKFLQWNEVGPDAVRNRSTSLAKLLLVFLISILILEQILAYSASYHPSRSSSSDRIPNSSIRSSRPPATA